MSNLGYWVMPCFSTSVLEIQAAIELVGTHRNESFVFATGAFDILHPGHIEYLKTASTFGSRLLVHVASDERIRELKGASRPILTLEERVCIIKALSVVDYVLVGRNTSLTYAKMIAPSCAVVTTEKKDKWTGLIDINGNPIESHFVKRIQDDVYSTTAIVQRILNRNVDGET